MPSERRLCCECGTPLTRGPNDPRPTCLRIACIESFRRSKMKAEAAERQLAAMRTDWPPEMAILKPVADNVRTVAAGRLGLPAPLAGGCSSSSGWDVEG